MIFVKDAWNKFYGNYNLVNIKNNLNHPNAIYVNLKLLLNPTINLVIFVQNKKIYVPNV
jgi:hypothetical protein